MDTDERAEVAAAVPLLDGDKDKWVSSTLNFSPVVWILAFRVRVELADCILTFLYLSLSIYSFNGIIIKPQHFGELTPDQFQQRLAGEKAAFMHGLSKLLIICVMDLSASLEAWRSEGKRGVWVKIPLSQAELVPVTAKVSPKKALLFGAILSFYWYLVSFFFSFKLGFEFHHARSDYIMMTQWLPVNEESTLPLYATHNIGTVIWGAAWARFDFHQFLYNHHAYIHRSGWLCDQW